MPDSIPTIWIIMIFGSTTISILTAKYALNHLRWFSSSEKKPGRFRIADQHAEYPLIGGLAIILSIIFPLLIAFRTQLSNPIVTSTILTLLCFGLVGFLDDAAKVNGSGLNETPKFLGLLLASIAVAGYWLIIQQIHGETSKLVSIGRLGLFMLVYTFAMLASSLSVDFTDGLDGLASGSGVIAALSYSVAIWLFTPNRSDWLILLGTMAGAFLGVLLHNLPPRANGERRTRIYLGDSGSLVMGALFANLAVGSNTMIAWLIIGGVFAIEGLSVVLYRFLGLLLTSFGQLPRYRDSHAPIHPREFPLPFIATPIHHHFELIGISPNHVVLAFWGLGIGFGGLGVFANYYSGLWIVFLAIVFFLYLLAILRTQNYFIGWRYDSHDEPRRISLYFGLPLELMGKPLYTEALKTNIKLDNMSRLERQILWKPMSYFDAYETIGELFYKFEYYQEAARAWNRLREGNLLLRPDVRFRLHYIASETEVNEKARIESKKE